jgi:ATP-dependent Clp protease protease subunit
MSSDRDEEQLVELCAGNHILFYADVVPKTVAQLRKILLELERNKKQTTVILHIHSDGGDAYSGFASFDIIKTCSLNVITLVEGTCSSAATLMSLAGTKRYMMPNGTYMIHQLSSDFSGTFEELRVDFENSTSIMNRCIKLYQQYSTMTEARLIEDLKTDREMHAKETMACGFIDAIWTGSLS